MRIGDRGLKSNCTARRALGVRRNPCATTTFAPEHLRGLRDHKVHGYVVWTNPRAGLWGLGVELKSRPPHRILELWGVCKSAGVECDVAVLGGLSERNLCAASVEVDRLRSDDDQSVKVGAQCVERIQ